MKDIVFRRVYEVNTDPQRRCYYGCHAKSELRWSGWEEIQTNVPDHDVERVLTFWRDLNDYAVSQRGEGSRIEYKAVDHGGEK